ncbi:MAG: PHP domain-containing protein [Myxococcota bacterium]
MSDRRTICKAVARAALAAALKDLPEARDYGGASWTIRQAEGDTSALVEAGLERLPGVDATLAAIGKAAFDGAASPELEALEADLPLGLFEIGQLKGLGAKKVKALWEELSITTVGELEYAAKENRLTDLKGFGAKTQQKVLEQIALKNARARILRRDEAKELARHWAAEAALAGLRIEAVGDYRRGAELADPLELLLGPAGENARALGARIRGAHPALVVHEAAEDWGAALVRHTGSPAHVAALETHGKDHSPPLAGETEGEVYARLGLAFTPPERREAHVPLVAIGKAVPRLIRREDLRGALHNHTTASDGTASLADMRAAAEARGLTYLAITEHSKTAAYARGLSPEALREQRETIAVMNAASPSCVLLSGVESDILRDGELDYDDELLATLDVVIASVHQRYRQDGETMTGRMCRAARHAHAALIGHPTGRLLLSREPTGVDMRALLEACREGGTAIELNANPQRLDLSAEHAAMAREHGVLVSIGADAHSVAGLDNLEHGVAIARRAGLRPEDVLNTRSVDELRAILNPAD